MKQEPQYKIKYEKEVKPELLKKFKYSNVNKIPKIQKIVINRGMGEATANSKVIEYSFEQMKQITGQKPLITKAKQSISNFKLRKGVSIGCKVTLRHKKMYDFLSKLVNINLPKIRDFRGVSSTGFDGAGNYTLGLREDTIFPEVHDVEKARGFNISIVTSATTDDEAYELLKLMGMPFRAKGGVRA
jgi:large subunit ribosomal protein L5